MVHAQQPSECGSLTKAENNACNIFQSFGMVPFFDQVRMEVMQAARSPAFAKRLYSLVSCVARELCCKSWMILMEHLKYLKLMRDLCAQTALTCKFVFAYKTFHIFCTVFAL